MELQRVKTKHCCHNFTSMTPLLKDRYYIKSRHKGGRPTLTYETRQVYKKTEKYLQLKDSGREGIRVGNICILILSVACMFLTHTSIHVTSNNSLAKVLKKVDLQHYRPHHFMLAQAMVCHCRVS